MLIIGLGNPGEKYKSTRHNVGFLCVDKIVSKLNIKNYKQSYNAHFYRSDKIDILKPMTFMNDSGSSLKAYIKANNAPSKIILIHDELDIAIGKLKIKEGGRSGGHNGVQNIIEVYSGQIVRVKIGIGKPEDKDVLNHVLSDFSTDEFIIINDMIEQASNKVIEIIGEKNV